MKVKKILQNYTAFILLAIFFAVVVYRIVMKHMMIEGCDYSNAAIRALTMFTDKNSNRRAYPLWPLGVKIFERIFGCDLFHSATYTTMIVYVLRFVVSFFFFRFYIGARYHGNICAILAAVSMIVQQISVVGLKNEVTWGIANINTWHNSTNPVALLFGICSLFCVFRVLENWEQDEKISVKWMILFAIANILADLGKPSFAQVFLPAIVVYCIGYCIKSRFENFKCCLAIAGALVPSFVILLLQSRYFFNWKNLLGGMQSQRLLVASKFISVSQIRIVASGVIIDWFDVMRNTWGNIPLSLLGMLAFPAYIVIAYFKTAVKDKKIIIAWLMYGFGFLEFAALAQEGNSKYHGNFGWGCIIALALLFMISMIHFMADREKGWNIRTIIGGVLLLLHFICGWNYMLWQINEPGFWY